MTGHRRPRIPASDPRPAAVASDVPVAPVAGVGGLDRDDVRVLGLRVRDDVDAAAVRLAVRAVDGLVAAGGRDHRRAGLARRPTSVSVGPSTTSVSAGRSGRPGRSGRWRPLRPIGPTAPTLPVLPVLPR